MQRIRPLQTLLTSILLNLTASCRIRAWPELHAIHAIQREISRPIPLRFASKIAGAERGALREVASGSPSIVVDCNGH